MSEVLSDEEVEEVREGFVSVWDFIGRRGPQVFTALARAREEVARLQRLVELPCPKKHDEKITELEAAMAGLSREIPEARSEALRATAFAREAEAARDEYKKRWEAAVVSHEVTTEKLEASRSEVDQLKQGIYRGNSVSYIYDKMACYRDQAGTLGEVARILGFKIGEGYDGNAEMRRVALEWAEGIREKINQLSRVAPHGDEVREVLEECLRVFNEQLTHHGQPGARGYAIRDRIKKVLKEYDR